MPFGPLATAGGGGGGGAPDDAQYVVMVANATLTQERILTGTASRIVVTDGGAGAAVTLDVGSYVVLNNQANTWTTGVQTINTGAIGNQALILKMHAGQTENGFEVQKSDGTVLSGADERGVVFSDAGTSTSNVFIGTNAGNAAAAGAGIVALGEGAGASLTTAGNSFFLGSSSGAIVTIGTQNTGIGFQSLLRLTNGSNNIAIGHSAGEQIQTGSNNLFVGTSSGFATRLGSQYNVYLGANTAYFGTGGAMSYNTLVGARAGYTLGSGSDRNTLIGYFAGRVLATNVVGCVMLGYQAGYQETVSNTLYIANSNTATPLIYGLFTGAGAGVTIHSQNTAGVPLIVKGAAAQTANLLELQESDGSIFVASGDGLAGSEFVINEQGENIDFRVESATYNAILVDADQDELELMSNAAGKIGMFAVNPVVQAAHIADPAGGGVVDAEARTAIDAILVAIENIGITASA